MKRQRRQEKPLVTRTAKVYGDEWDELKQHYDEKGSGNVSMFIRDAIAKELKKVRRNESK